mgnify:CR=1 FL=1
MFSGYSRWTECARAIFHEHCDCYWKQRTSLAFSSVTDTTLIYSNHLCLFLFAPVILPKCVSKSFNGIALPYPKLHFPCCITLVWTTFFCKVYLSIKDRDCSLSPYKFILCYYIIQFWTMSMILDVKRGTSKWSECHRYHINWLMEYEAIEGSNSRRVMLRIWTRIVQIGYSLPWFLNLVFFEGLMKARTWDLISRGFETT